ncbi:hypothetical protein TNCV_2844321 [Trichonephila clavipes]|nr:hypothetical protein TNCV_2844321 [Trichonephila clavipes]
MLCLRDKRILWTSIRSCLSDAGISVSSRTTNGRLADIRLKGTYEIQVKKNRKHTTEKYTHLLTMGIPAFNKKGCAAFPFETGIHYRRKTDFFPEEDITMSYLGFEPEPTRLEAEGHSCHTG